MSATFKVGGIRILPDTDGSQTNFVEFADASNNLATRIRSPLTYGASGSVSGSASGSVTGNVDYVLPSTQGASGTVLANDGAGNLSWQFSLLLSLQLKEVTSSPYTVQASDQLLIFKTGSVVANLLPGASQVRKILYMLNAASTTVTLFPASGDTVGGQTSLALTAGSCFQVVRG